MASTSTISSRLRKLVAKVFHAEKLYSSVAGTSVLKSTLLSEITNDLRAREWSKTHSELRQALNGILSEGGDSAAYRRRVVALRGSFLNRLKDIESLAARETELLQKSLDRRSYSHLLKISITLNRLKARAQSVNAIVQELSSVLGPGAAPLDPESIAPTSSSARSTNVVSLLRRRA